MYFAINRSRMNGSDLAEDKHKFSSLVGIQPISHPSETQSNGPLRLGPKLELLPDSRSPFARIVTQVTPRRGGKSPLSQGRALLKNTFRARPRVSSFNDDPCF